MLFAESKQLTESTCWTLIGIGILMLILAIGATIFFINFKNAKKIEKDSFKTITTKFQIFRFWQYYGIIILMLTGYVCAVILIPIGIEGLIKLG